MAPSTQRTLWTLRRPPRLLEGLALSFGCRTRSLEGALDGPLQRRAIYSGGAWPHFYLSCGLVRCPPHMELPIAREATFPWMAVHIFRAVLILAPIG